MVEAMTQSFLGYHDQAIALYERALQHRPNSSTLNSAIAEAYEHLGDYTSAIFYAQQALTLNKEELYYHQQLVHLFIQAGDTGKAETQLLELLTLFPNNAESLKELARIQLLNDQHPEALKTIDRILSRIGPMPDLLEEKLIILKRLEAWKEIEATLLQLEEFSNSKIQYKIERAALYVSQGKEEEGVRLLNEALRLTPSDPELLFSISELYHRTGNQEQALHFVRQSLEISPDHVGSLALLGTILFENESFSEAAPLLQRAAYANPRNTNAWQHAAEALLHAQRPAEAADLADEALLLFPGQLPLLYLSARAHMQSSNEELAYIRFKEYLALYEELDTPEKNGKVARVYEHVGDLLLKQGKSEEAVAIWSKALQLNPDNPILQEKLKIHTN